MAEIQLKEFPKDGNGTPFDYWIPIERKDSNGVALVNELIFDLSGFGEDVFGYWWVYLNDKELYIPGKPGDKPSGKGIVQYLKQGINSLKIAYGTPGYTTANPIGATYATVEFNYDSKVPELLNEINYKKIGVSSNDLITIDFNENIKLNKNLIILTDAKTQLQINISESQGNEFLKINGSSITINLKSFVENNSTYTLDFKKGSILDLSGNIYQSLINLEFATQDTISPYVKKTSPLDASKNNEAKTNITIEFNEPILIGEGSISISNSDGTLVGVVDTKAMSIDQAGRILKFEVATALKRDQVYQIRLDSNAITDKAGNTLKNPYDFSISTEDTINPIIKYQSGGSLNNKLDQGSDIIVYFSEPVLGGLENKINITDEENNTVLSIMLDEQINTIASEQFKIYTKNKLQPGSLYKIILSEGAFKDQSGNITQEISLPLYTSGIGPATTIPSPVSFSPKQGATEVELESEIIIDFDKELVKGVASIYLKDANGRILEEYKPGDERISFKSKSIIITPSNKLVDSLIYNVELSVGSVFDKYGNFNSLSKSSFSTVDKTPPTPITYSGEYKNIKPGEAILFKFGERILAGEINIVIYDVKNLLVKKYGSKEKEITFSDNVLTINTPDNLNYESTYELKILAGSIVDYSGNVYLQDYIVKLVTTIAPDIISPKVVSYDLAKDSILEDLNTNISINFSEHIQIGVGKVYLKYASGEVFETYGEGLEGVSVDFNKLVINPRSPLVDGRDYFVEIEADAVRDLSGNAYIGDSKFTFSTLDTTPPYVQFISSSFTDINDSIISKMSESIKYGAGSAVLKKGSTVIEYFYANKSNSSIINDTLAINPSVNLLPTSSYTITIGEDFIRDKTGNKLPAKNLLFVTSDGEDNVAPTFKGISFTKMNSGLAAIDSEIEFNFNEYVMLGSGEINLVDLNGTVVERYSKEASNLSVKDRKVTINPIVDLKAGKDYKFIFSSNAISDLAGNYVGNLKEYEFKTENKFGYKMIFWKDNTKVPSETKKADAVNLTDAIAILKMIVGLNVNSNNTPLSPYQAIAADFDQDGSVGLTDAIGVLKMVVGLSAPTPTWKYYDDTKLASAYTSVQSLNPKGWTTSAAISDTGTADSGVKLVGVLTGDVDGSWVSA